MPSPKWPRAHRTPGTGACNDTHCTAPPHPTPHTSAGRRPHLRLPKPHGGLVPEVAEPVGAPSPPLQSLPKLPLAAHVDGSVGLAVGAAGLPGPLHCELRLPGLSAALRAPSRKVGPTPPRPRPGPASGALPPPFPRALSCAAAPGGPAPPRPRGDAQAEPWEGLGRSPLPPTAGRSGSAPPPRPPRAGWPWAGALGGPPGKPGVSVCH